MKTEPQTQSTTEQHSILHYTYRDRHIVADNLGKKSGILAAIPSYYNFSYCAFYTVLQGSMDISVNGIHLQLRPNDFLVVMPCSTVELHDSRCIFFSDTIQAHALFDLYEEVNMNLPMQKRAFCFRLYHFSSMNIERFKDIYLMIKREIQRPDYRMKENTLRALTKLVLVTLQEASQALVGTLEIPYAKNRQQQIFDQFIELLDIYYTRERSVQFYAKKLSLSPKYLSMISQASVGESASVVINYYVTFRIKQLLYRGQLSVKQISEMLNFPTQSFFGRYFKRVVGISPRQYMKQNCRNYNE